MSETKGEYAAHISGVLKPCPFCGDPDVALEADLQARLADAEASLAGYRKVTDDLCRRLQERQP